MTVSPHQNISSLGAGTGPGLSTAVCPALVPAEQGSGEALSLPLMNTIGRLVFCVLTSNSNLSLSFEQPWVTGNCNRFRKCAVGSLPENRWVEVRVEGSHR